MRLVGVSVPIIAAGVVTDDALSSMDTCSKSLGSRTRKTRVSIIFLGSLLNEYCTVENVACTENSRRRRTQSAVPESEANCALSPACRNVGLSPRLERPRSTSKSGPKSACLGTRLNAETISCWLSAEGEHTLSIL